MPEALRTRIDTPESERRNRFERLHLFGDAPIQGHERFSSADGASPDDILIGRAESDLMFFDGYGRARIRRSAVREEELKANCEAHEPKSGQRTTNHVLNESVAERVAFVEKHGHSPGTESKDRLQNSRDIGRPSGATQKSARADVRPSRGSRTPPSRTAYVRNEYRPTAAAISHTGRVKGPPRKVKYLALTGAFVTIVIFGVLEAHSMGKERRAGASAEASAKFWTPDHTIAGFGQSNTPGLKAE